MTIHSVVIQKLLSTNAHLGRRVAAHHFKIYSCGSRNAMTIIDSDKTLICMRNACNFIGNLVRSKGRFLFVNTNTLFDDIIEEMTKAIGIKNDNSWRLGGFLTNRWSPKKFRGRNKKFNLGALHAPDCVVIFDTERKSSVILEADRLQIPIVGIVDPSMPWETYKKITYPIPANDSVQFVYLFCNLITKTFLYQQRKIKAALGATAKEESKAETREDDVHIATADRKGKIFVLPFGALLPPSEDVSDLKLLLDKLVVLKFNGSLGTNMGFSGPKSALEVKDGMSCLDFIINQIEYLNSKYGCSIPLLLANSINTHDSTLKALMRHPNKNIHAFLQGQDHQSHATEAQHQDRMSASNQYEVYLSLKNSNKLDVLLSQGKEYILVLNSDNLANVVEPKILNYLVQNKVETCMEVMPASSDMEATEATSHEGKYEPKENLKFTDTVWVSMTSIERLTQRVSLNESYSTMSKFFDRASAINVPRARYLPVEGTSDLLLYQSDLYSFDEGIPTRNPARKNPADPLFELGPEFANVNDFHKRFKSMPSIIELDRLAVTGDVWFGSGVTLKGKVYVLARPGVKIVVPDGSVLENKIISRPSDIPSSI